MVDSLRVGMFVVYTGNDEEERVARVSGGDSVRAALCCAALLSAALLSAVLRCSLLRCSLLCCVVMVCCDGEGRMLSCF